MEVKWPNTRKYAAATDTLFLLVQVILYDNPLLKWDHHAVVEKVNNQIERNQDLDKDPQLVYS